MPKKDVSPKPKKQRNYKRHKELLTTLSPKEYEFCTLLAQRIPVRQAEKQVGWAETYGSQILRKPYVMAYLEKLKIKVQEKQMAKVSREIAKNTQVTRADVMERLKVLMNLDPKATNKNITGQVKAASELCEVLGMKISRSVDMTKQFEKMSKEELLFFTLNGYEPESAQELAQFVEAHREELGYVDQNQSRPN